MTESAQAAFDDLRARAEEAIAAASGSRPGLNGGLTPGELTELLHELQVHQIELELQNEELRRSREELEDSRARYFELFDLAPVGYLSLTQKGLIVEANLTFVSMVGPGVSRSALVGKPLAQFIEREDKDVFYLLHKALFETGLTQDCDLRMVRGDGEQFWVRLAAIPAADSSVCLIVVSDITERVTAAQEAAALREEAEQAQKMETVGRLAGGVAHDLNNLLTPILAYSELLLGDLATDDASRGSVEEILRAAEGARDLVRQLLNFSRRQVSHATLLDLNETVASFDAMLRRTIRGDIAIEFSRTPISLCILGDANQLGQVVLNLAVNAQDAMPRGGALTIATSMVEVGPSSLPAGLPAGSYAQLTVSDTGWGMDGETRRQIFEPFYTTKAKGLGTGLGLATVHTIVKQHGGTISVKSEPGQGTTFEMRFAVVEGRPVSAEATARGALEESPGGSECILLVEDNSQVRDLAQAILERLGYTVLPAGDAQEALSVLAENEDSVDMILSDVVMPGMKGPELVAKVSQTRPDIRALLMSGYTDAALDPAILGGSVRFIHKPFTVQALARSVRGVLDS